MLLARTLNEIQALKEWQVRLKMELEKAKNLGTIEAVNQALDQILVGVPKL